MPRKKTPPNDLPGDRPSAGDDREGASLLAVRTEGEDWLIPLSDSGEIIPLPELTPVPLTRPFFAGIANIRGNLYAVTDFSAFRGTAPVPRNAAARLLLVGTRHGSNVALLVSGMYGLRGAGDFTPLEPDPSEPAWAAGRCRDDAGKDWRLLTVTGLLADERFMNIGI